MEGIKLLRDEESAKIKKILFERPISRLNSRSIGILAGRHAALKNINDMHAIISSLNHSQVIVAENDLKQHGVPAELYLQTAKKTSQYYENTDEAIETLNNCNFVVVGLDIEINSRLQIFLEKLISARPSPIIFTSESIGLFKISPQLIDNRAGDIIVANTKSLIELCNYLSIPINFKPEAGMYNKLGMMFDICKHTKSSVVCVEDYQILATDYKNSNQAVVINITNNENIKIDYYYTAVLASLLCDRADSQVDIIDRLLTAGYLVRNSVSKTDFANNLKKLLTKYR